PWQSRRRVFARRAAPAPPLMLPADIPEQIGTFALRGAVVDSGPAAVLVGVDAALDREVWIWLRPASDPGFSAARRQVGRTTRLRWLTGGLWGEKQWDAFLAPTGEALPLLVAAGGRLSWAEFR